MPFEPQVLTAVVLYILLAVLPGLAVLQLLGFRSADPFVQLGLAAGTGLALQPLVYLWAHAIDVPLGPGAWWAVLLGSAAVVAARSWRREPRSLPRSPGSEDDHMGVGGSPPTARWAVLAILALVLASRWYAAAALSAPLWGDSVHHAMIVHLFSVHGGLVEDWQPLSPLSTFTYHFGLHAGVASLVWLTELPPHRALLVAGQVLSVLGVLTAYALVAGLTGRPWAGVGAALAAGGLSSMPAFYINWGRYTQLAGQVVLPAAALAAAWAASTPAWPGDVGVAAEPITTAARGRDRHPWRGVLLSALLAAGLFLTHYLVALFYALFVLAWLWVGGREAEGVGRRARAAVRLSGVALLSLLLVLPWLPQLAAGPLGGHAVRLATSALPNPAVAGVVPPSFVWGDLGRHLGWGLVIGILGAAGWGLARRERTVLLGMLWTALLLLAAYPQLLGLPITGVLKDFTVVIGLYVPAGLVVGGALGDAVDVLAARRPAAASMVWIGLVGLAALLAWKDRAVVVPDHVFVTPADERAMAWIRGNTPSESVFLASSLLAYGDTVVVGEDAGWWIPLLAERRTTVPPATVGIERSYDPDYRERLNRLVSLWQGDLDAPATRAALAAEGVTHAYVGVRANRSGVARLSAARLAASPFWDLVYDEGEVKIFVFHPRGGDTDSPGPESNASARD